MDGSYFTTCSKGRFYIQMSENQVGGVFWNMLGSYGTAMICRLSTMLGEFGQTIPPSIPCILVVQGAFQVLKVHFFDGETPKCYHGRLSFIPWILVSKWYYIVVAELDLVGKKHWLPKSET